MITEPTGLYSWRVAYLIAPAMRWLQDRADAAGQEPPEELAAFMGEVAELAARYAKSRTAEVGSDSGTKGWVSVEEAARLLGVTPRAIRKRITTGSLPAERVGRSYLVLRPERQAS